MRSAQAEPGDTQLNLRRLRTHIIDVGHFQHLCLVARHTCIAVGQGDLCAATPSQRE